MNQKAADGKPEVEEVGPGSWTVTIEPGELERWAPELSSMPGDPCADLQADLDHVVATLLPIANFIRAVCGQSKLDAGSLEQLLLAAAPHRR